MKQPVGYCKKKDGESVLPCEATALSQVLKLKNLVLQIILIKSFIRVFKGGTWLVQFSANNWPFSQKYDQVMAECDI